MSTWDDKPNDYEHALVVIEGLRAEIERLRKLLRDMIENVGEALKHDKS